MTKDAKNMPMISSKRITEINNRYYEAQLLHTGIRLNVFSYLDTPITAADFAEKTGYDRRNSILLLNALTSASFVSKNNDLYENTQDIGFYLSKNSEYYFGDHMLFWHEIRDLSPIEELVRNGPTYNSFKDTAGSDSYDFKKMAEVAVNQMYSGRIQTFISKLKQIYDEDYELKSIDLGGGSGMMSVELINNFPRAHATLFDQKSILSVARNIIEKNDMENRISLIEGDFIEDEIGKNYDLVIACGIFDFCGDLRKMSRKIYDSLNCGGYLYADTHLINEDYTSPSPCILGWLKSNLDGLEILKTDKSIIESTIDSGFSLIESPEDTGCPYYLFKK